MSGEKSHSGSHREPAPVVDQASPERPHPEQSTMYSPAADPSAAESPPPPRRRRRVLAAAVGAGLLLAGAAGGYALGNGTATAGPAATVGVTAHQHGDDGPGRGRHGGPPPTATVPDGGTGTST